MIDLLTRLFGPQIFDSAIFLLEQDIPSMDTEDDINTVCAAQNEAEQEMRAAQQHIANTACCTIARLTMMSVKPLVQTASLSGVQVNWVGSTLSILDMVAKQTYQVGLIFRHSFAKLFHVLTPSQSYFMC